MPIGDIDKVPAIMGYLASCTTPVLIANSGNEVIFANNAFAGLFGAEWPWLVGKYISDLTADTGHPHDADIDSWLEKTSGKPQQELAVKALSSDGKPFDLIITDRRLYTVGDDVYQCCSARLA